MGSELVRYESSGPAFTPAVTAFSHTLGPLVGLSKFVAKLMASRVESKRLSIVEARDRYEHAERMQATQLQAATFERHSERLCAAKLREVEAFDLASQRETAVLIKKIEAEYDIAVTAIRVNAKAQRYQLDQQFALQLRAIDNALAISLRKLGDNRRRSDQGFRLALEQNKIVKVELDELNLALRNLTKLIGANNRTNAALAAATLPAISSAIADVVGNGISPVHALLAAVTEAK